MMTTKKIDDRLAGLEEEIVLLSGRLSTGVAENLSGPLDDLKTLLAGLEKNISVGFEQKDMSGAVTAELGTIESALAHISAALDTLEEQTKQDLLANRLDALSGTMSTEAKALGTRLSEVTSAGKTNADDIKNALSNSTADIVKKTEEITGLIEKSGILKAGQQIDAMGKRVEKATEAIPALPAQVKKQLEETEKRLQEKSDAVSAAQEEAKKVLMKDHDELHRSLEIIRRMCTTDEEKYLGTLATLMNERISALSAELPEQIAANRQKILALDKSILSASQNAITKQDEAKKLILFDVATIGKTADEIKRAVATGADTMIGAEVSRIAVRTDRIAEDVPSVLDRVNTIASGMDRMTAQVNHMRWLVAGAVGISLIVLIVSFFV
jgi:hypothetical protein